MPPVLGLVSVLEVLSHNVQKYLLILSDMQSSCSTKAELTGSGPFCSDLFSHLVLTPSFQFSHTHRHLKHQTTNVSDPSQFISWFCSTSALTNESLICNLSFSKKKNLHFWYLYTTIDTFISSPGFQVVTKLSSFPLYSLWLSSC